MQLLAEAEGVVGHLHLVQIQPPNRGLHRHGDRETLAVTRARRLGFFAAQQHRLGAVLHAADQRDAFGFGAMVPTTRPLFSISPPWRVCGSVISHSAIAAASNT